jgi:hypothetical protein
VTLGLTTRERFTASAPERVRQTVALVERRGYALSPSRIAALCLGGPLSEQEVLAAVAASPGLVIADGLVASELLAAKAARLRARQRAHLFAAPSYRLAAVRFAVRLASRLPFVLAVSIAGSLASGGFTETDDVDLNLVVEDRHKHLAYVGANLLGLLNAVRYRTKPVDDLSARPLAPRVMTVNLVLELSDCFPLARTDADMAYELLTAEPVVGAPLLEEIVLRNQDLLNHFPQLAQRRAPLAREPSWRAPRSLFPAALDRPARTLGRAAWRYMQWTRRSRPEALARVAYVRATMAPYTLFADADH